MVVMVNPSDNSVFELMNQRKQLEQQIAAQEQVLRENRVGMNDPLIDGEGYPLPNIDIYAVRMARKRINELNTDYGILMKKIEIGLELYYRENKNRDPSADGNSGGSGSNARNYAANQYSQRETVTTSDGQVLIAPIVDSPQSGRGNNGGPDSSSRPDLLSSPNERVGIGRVDLVESGSPADQDGVKLGDVILQLGDISHLSTPGNLSPIAVLVQQSINVPLPVVVRRLDGVEETFMLTPRTWSGRGLLGCHIVPL